MVGSLLTVVQVTIPISGEYPLTALHTKEDQVCLRAMSSRA